MGVGKIMGFNFEKAGYDNVETMVQKSIESEDEQLLAMANFLKATGLDRPLPRRIGLRSRAGTTAPISLVISTTQSWPRPFSDFSILRCRTSRFGRHKCCCRTPGSTRVESTAW